MCHRYQYETCGTNRCIILFVNIKHTDRIRFSLCIYAVYQCKYTNIVTVYIVLCAKYRMCIVCKDAVQVRYGYCNDTVRKDTVIPYTNHIPTFYRGSVQKLLIYSIAERDISAQETCHILLGIPLYHSSQSFVILNLNKETARWICSSGESTRFATMKYGQTE